MKKLEPKRPLQLKLKPAAKPLKPAVKKTSPKPKRVVRLSKSDPDYFSKMGKLSAKRNWRTPEMLAEWGRKGHLNRDPSTYKGGRPKKNVA